MHPAFIPRVALDTGVPEVSVAAAVALLEEGGTPPFIARYRRELTGAIDEFKLRAIRERMSYYKELQERRAIILKTISDQGKLTNEVRQKIETCFVKVELEDLLLPFRPRRKTKGTEAVEKGLEPLAEYLWNQEADAWSPEEHMEVFVDPEKGVSNREEALRGASDIIAEWISENPDHRQHLRKMMWKDGFLVSKVVPAKKDQKTKYNMYYDRREPLATIPSHRVLAIRRGTHEGILSSNIEFDDARAVDFLTNVSIHDRDSVFAPLLQAIARDSYFRLLRPAIENDILIQIKEKADQEAIRVFQENLANLLLSPPGGPMVVIGLGPSRGGGSKLAVVDESGNFLEESLVSPASPNNDLEGARATVKELIAKHNVRALAIGSDTGSRETEVVIRQILQEEKLEHIVVAGVNDAGVSAYATSRTAREEFPNLDIAARSAVSIARRLQDPLMELVKIDPKTIGVGQYQHDVDQKALHRGLIQTMQSCVNSVGVDLNRATFALLRHVAGINETVARKIIAHRSAAGSFPSRASLLNVPGVEPKTFQQAAGFLRVQNGENPLDRTAVHPESYPLVDRMATTLGVSIGELIGNKPLISNLKLEEFVTDNTGLPTLCDIREELLKPGRDPRQTFAVPKVRADVKEIQDLKEGMTLEGTVTNVTNFGAFVDIGLHQDGLVHLSQMSNRFIRDPRLAVRVGQVVQVKVISVEVETKRIGLSMKALLPPRPYRRKKQRRRSTGSPAANLVPTVPNDESSAASTLTPSSDRPAAEKSSGPTVHPRDGRSRGRRNHRKRNRRFEKPQQQHEPAPSKPQEPEVPEPTLEEKIAILQSKFRGISKG